MLASRTWARHLMRHNYCAPSIFVSLGGSCPPIARVAIWATRHPRTKSQNWGKPQRGASNASSLGSDARSAHFPCVPRHEAVHSKGLHNEDFTAHVCAGTNSK